MKFDYSRPLAVAKRQIDRFGRQIELVRPTEVKADPDRPWRGISGSETPFILPVQAVQATPNQVRIFDLSALGESGKLEGLVQISEIIYIVFQGENDLRQFTFVRDDGIDYVIQATQALKPGDTTLLGFLGVRR